MIATGKTIKLALRKLDHPAVIMFAVINIMVVIAAAASIGRYDPSTVIAALPTPGIIVVYASPPAVPTPAGITVAAAQARWIPAFDQPAGNVLGAVPLPELGALLVVRSDGWAMIEWDGGPKWLRVADMGFSLADVSPERIIVVSAPAAAQATPTAEPAPDWYHDIATPPPGFTQALIDPSRPDAPACENPVTHQISPLCGDLTNGEAMTAVAARQ